MILKELFNGKLIGSSFIWHLVFAFLMGSIFWLLYFKEDLTELQFRKEDVDDMVRKLYTS